MSFDLTTEQRERLKQRILRMSLHFGKEDVQKPLILVSTPGSLLETGFQQAQKYLKDGQAVHLVGHGVTLQHVRPEWVSSHSGAKFILTELGAYVSEAFVTPWNLALRNAVRKWLGQCFKKAASELEAEEIFLSSVINRFLCLDNDPSRYTSMVKIHADSEFIFTDPYWEGAWIHQTLEKRTSRAGCLWAQILFATKIFFLLPIYSCAAIFRILKNYLGSKQGVRKIAIRREATQKKKPEAWFVLAANNKRINAQLVKHIIHGLPKAMGLFLSGDLRMLIQKDSDLKSAKSDIFLEGLGDLLKHLEHFSLDQIVWPDSITSIFWCIYQCWVIQIKSVIAVIKQGPFLELGEGVRINFNHYMPQILRILSIDLLSAQIGYETARLIFKRQELEGIPVVFASANSPELSTFCWYLAQKGAHCVEHLHGTHAAASEASPIKFRWDQSERETSRLLGEKVIFAGTPPLLDIKRLDRSLHEPVRILFLSNYVHRDSVTQGRYPAFCFQEEMLGTIPLIQTQLFSSQLRWRPHPADSREAVYKTSEKYKTLNLSLTGTIEKDLNWADIVISSLSTSISQALLMGLPVFVHLIPDFQGSYQTCFISSKRIFFRSNELAPKIIEFLEHYLYRKNEAFQPEREARVALFGVLERPTGFWDGLSARYDSI